MDKKPNNIRILEFLISNNGHSYDSVELSQKCDIKRPDVASKMARELVKINGQALEKYKSGRKTYFQVIDVNEANSLLSGLVGKKIKFYKSRPSTGTKKVKVDEIINHLSLNRIGDNVISQKGNLFGVVNTKTGEEIIKREYKLGDLLNRYNQIMKINLIIN